MTGLVGFDTETTAVACDGTGYACRDLALCSWYGRVQVQPEGGGLVFQSQATIRVPALPLGQTAPPQVGEYVLPGAVEAVSGPEELAALGARRVLALGDNRRGPGLQHWVVIVR